MPLLVMIKGQRRHTLEVEVDVLHPVRDSSGLARTHDQRTQQPGVWNQFQQAMILCQHNVILHQWVIQSPSKHAWLSMKEGGV